MFTDILKDNINLRGRGIIPEPSKLGYPKMLGGVKISLGPAENLTITYIHTRTRTTKYQHWFLPRKGK